MSISCFIETCHLHIKAPNKIVEGNRDRSFRTLRSLIKNSTGYTPKSNGKDWLNIIFADSNKDSGHSIDFYYDLVELASALDHIDI